MTACGGGGGGGSSSSGPSSVSTPSPTADSTPSADQDPKGEVVEPTPTVEAPATTDASFARVNTEVLQAKCMMCHMDGGLAGGTSLTYANPSSSIHEIANYNVVMNYFDAADGNKEKYLQKAQGGLAHGGGAVLNSSSAEYKLLNDWIDSLDTEDETAAVEAPTAPTARGFFEDVQLVSPEQTLRRAALVFARRLPTDSELAAVRKGGESALPNLIRGLMTGDGFEQFLIEGADEVGKFVSAFVDAGQESHSMILMHDTTPEGTELAIGFENKYGNRHHEDGPQRWQFTNDYVSSVGRQPVVLIKYIVTNDRNYQEILTADYTMINPFINQVYRSNVNGLPSFSIDVYKDFETYEAYDGLQVYKPGKNYGRVTQWDDKFKAELVEFINDDGSKNSYNRVLAHGRFIAPNHSGILTMPSFLNRYPSTETNRNRARAGWMYKFFLDVDIEKSAPQTTDPVALADTNDPTMNNKNCNVCHQHMNPVAGAFKMYDNDGRYNIWGNDVLPWKYKDDPNSGYQHGDTWFRDMRTPGFEGTYASTGLDTLPWLGRAIANDSRFGKGTVSFWWLPVMGNEPVIAPQDMNDTTYNNQLALFNEQDRVMNEIGSDFMRNGYNAKDMFVAMAMTHFFRSVSVSDNTAIAANTSVGGRRLLSVDELEAKIEATTGMDFMGWTASAAHMRRTNTVLTSNDRFRIAAGGTDTRNVETRGTKETAVVSNTIHYATNLIMCGAVIKDFDTNGAMFCGIDRNTTDPTKLKNKIVELYDRFLGEKLTTTSLDVVDTYDMLVLTAKERRDNNKTWATLDVECVWEEDRGWEKYDGNDPKGMIYAWTDVISFLLTDYKFIHE